MEKMLVLEAGNEVISQPLNIADYSDNFFVTHYSSSVYYIITYTLKANVIRTGIIGRNCSIDTASIPLYPGKRRHFVLQYFYNVIFRKKLEIEHPITVIHNPWCPGYFHWVTEALVRLILYDENGSPDAKIVLPSNFRQFPYVEESIRSITSRDIHYFSDNVFLTSQSLSYISNNNYTAKYNPKIIKQLRRKVIDACCPKPDKKNRKVYVSRAKARQRKIANENEILIVLSKYDFEIVHFEDLSFREQVKLMSETNVLISIHGAGLTNLMFMPTGSRVLEIQKKPKNGEHPSSIFQILADICDIKYYCQFGDSSDKQDNIYTSDIIVDLEEIRHNVRILDDN